MINPLIKEQLEKCNIKLPYYDDNTARLIIPKQQVNERREISLQIGRYYVIRIAKYILYPPENFTLDSNWNNGIHPQSEYMIATPVKFVGKMVQFDGCGYDFYNRKSLDDVYNGLWLPQSGIKIIEEII